MMAMRKSKEHYSRDIREVCFDPVGEALAASIGMVCHWPDAFYLLADLGEANEYWGFLDPEHDHILNSGFIVLTPNHLSYARELEKS